MLRKCGNSTKPAQFHKVEEKCNACVFGGLRERVMDEGPWSLEGNTIVLQRWELGMTGDDFDNTK